MSLFTPDYVKLLQRYCQSSIRLKFGENATMSIGVSHFGGQPDVPEGFQWPIYQNMPLTFLMQLSCEEFAEFDINNELPKKGLLSFFYALDNEVFGYDTRQKDGIRVFWFDGSQSLRRMDYVVGISAKNMLPNLSVSFVREATYPHLEDFTVLIGKGIDDYDKFEVAEKSLGIQRNDCIHRTLGWADLIQNNAAWNCERMLQKDSASAPVDDSCSNRQSAVHHWKLLLQLGTVQVPNFTLMFGDAGKLFFYIPQEDLKEGRFDRVYGEMQCY